MILFLGLALEAEGDVDVGCEHMACENCTVKIEDCPACKGANEGELENA
jgi:hypothetical protein